jgi:uncharacterized protein (TIGR03067 family)
MVRVGLLIAAAGLVGLTASTGGASADALQQAKESTGSLGGAWEVVSAERDGKELGGDFKGTKWVFTATTLAARFPGEGEVKFAYEARQVDKLGTIDLEVVESARDGGPGKRVYRGIYSVEGDTLKICYAVTGAARPTQFATKKDSGNTYFVLKR